MPTMNVFYPMELLEKKTIICTFYSTEQDNQTIEVYSRGAIYYYDN